MRPRVLALTLLLLSPAAVGCLGEGEEASVRPPAEAAAPAGPPAPVLLPAPGASGPPDAPEAPRSPPPEGAVVVRVRPGEVLATLDRRFYGVNVADWRPQDYRPEPDPEFLAHLDALRPGVLRWPAGHTSQALVWTRASDPDVRRPLTPEHVEDFLALARAVDAEPLLAVNLKTGTPEQAANLVRYVNVERGHGVTWWQIGNEPDHKDGLTKDAASTARRFVAFAEAMRAVDPSIRIVGPEIMTGAHVVPTNRRPDWLTPMMDVIGPHVDAVSWHYYPLDSNQPNPHSPAYPRVENLFQEEAKDWRPSGLSFADEVFPALRAVADRHAPGAEVWVTEIAEDSGGGGAPGIADAHAGALWTADVMGRFARHDPDALMRFVFKSGGSHRFTLLDEENHPRPAYWVYWLYANQFGTRVVDAASSDVASVAAHAALRDDGKLALVLVNKEERARDAWLDGVPLGRAEAYVLEAPAYDAREASLNGETPTLEGVAPREVDLGAAALTLPPRSMTLLVLDAGADGGA